MWCCPSPPGPGPDDEFSLSFFSVATSACREVIVLERPAISLARSALDGSTMRVGGAAAGDEVGAAAGGGVAGADGAGIAARAGAAVGGSAEREEEDRDRDTRLSRASGPRVAGPRLRSS